MKRLGIVIAVVAIIWVAAVALSFVVGFAVAPKANSGSLTDLLSRKPAVTQPAPAAGKTPVPGAKTPAPGAKTPAPAQTAVPSVDNRAYLGVSLADIDAQTAQQFSLNQQTGVVIASVVANSPAAKAGLQAGDVISKVNGVAVQTAQDTTTQVRKAKAGDVVTLDIIRAGKPQTIKVTAGQIPADQQAPAQPQPNRTPAPGNNAPQQTPAVPGGRGQGRATPGAGSTAPITGTNRAYLGVSLADIDAQTAQQFNLSQQTGVVIASVVANSPAATAGLQAGDVINQVNGVAVQTAQDAVNAVRAAKAGDVITLAITRGGQAQTVKVTSAQQPMGQQNAPAMPGNGQPSTPANPGNRQPNTPANPSAPANPGAGQQRLLPALPPELQGLLSMTATQQFSSNLGATFSFKDASGKIVNVAMIPGTIKQVNANSITVTPNNPQSKGGPYSIDSTTLIMAGQGKTTAGDLAVNDQVMLVVVGDSNHASLITSGSMFNLGQFLRPGFRFGAPSGDNGQGSSDQSNNQGNNSQGNNGQLQLPFGNGQIPFVNGNGQLQLPDDFFQNPQKYLGNLGSLLDQFPQLRQLIPQQTLPGQEM